MPAPGVATQPANFSNAGDEHSFGDRMRSYQYCGFCRQIFTGLRMQVLGIMVESLEV